MFRVVKRDGITYTPFFSPLCRDGSGAVPSRFPACQRGKLIFEFFRLWFLRLARASLHLRPHPRKAATTNQFEIRTLSFQNARRTLPDHLSSSSKQCGGPGFRQSGCTLRSTRSPELSRYFARLANVNP